MFFILPGMWLIVKIRDRKRPEMKIMIGTLLWVVFAGVVAGADDFSGTWKVVTVTYGDTYMGEIKYPEWFSIDGKNGVLAGRYTDQYGAAGEFEKVVMINKDRELLLSLCCGTKHAESWAPLHKVKMMDNGMLSGVVVTNRFEFSWRAEPAEVKPVHCDHEGAPCGTGP